MVVGAATAPATTPTAPVSTPSVTTFVVPAKSTSTISSNQAENETAKSTPDESTPVVVKIPTKLPPTVVETPATVPATPPTERFARLLTRGTQGTVVTEPSVPEIETAIVVPAAEVITPTEQPTAAPPSRFNRLAQRQNALAEATPIESPVIEVAKEVVEVAPPVVETPVKVVVEVTPTVDETVEAQPVVNEISEVVDPIPTPVVTQPEVADEPAIVEVSAVAEKIETPAPRFSRLVNRWGSSGSDSTPATPIVSEPVAVVPAVPQQSVAVATTIAILPSKQISVQSVPATTQPTIERALARTEIQAAVPTVAESSLSSAKLQSVPVFAFSFVRESELAASIFADDSVATASFDLAIQDAALAAYAPQAKDVTTMLARRFAETHGDAEHEPRLELQITRLTRHF